MIDIEIDIDIETFSLADDGIWSIVGILFETEANRKGLF